MKLRPFELALVIIFVVLLFAALFLLGTYKAVPKDASEAIEIGTVNIWGVLPAEAFREVQTKLLDVSESYLGVNYRYVPPDDFAQELISALAYERGPDAVLLSHEMLAEMRHHIAQMSTDSDGFPLRDVKNLYVDGAQIFVLSDGLYAYPIAVDPLMLFWNRQQLTNAGYFDPPASWEELVNDHVSKLTIRNADRSIKKSAVAMGEYQNVRNAFGIISLLLLQGGSVGVVEDNSLSRYSVRLNQDLAGTAKPFSKAVGFYTRFSRSVDPVYSWNRSLPEDRSEFVAGNLALYFGFASEGRQIERINPNFDFDIAEVPQGEQATIKRTYGRFYGLAQLKTATNKYGAATVLGVLAQSEYADMLAMAANMAPVFRSTVQAGSDDLYGRVAYRSAPFALGWLNPQYAEAQLVFKDMIEDINGNRSSIDIAVDDAGRKLARIYEIEY